MSATLSGVRAFGHQVIACFDFRNVIFFIRKVSRYNCTDSPVNDEKQENSHKFHPNITFGDGGVPSPFRRLDLDLQRLLDRTLISRFSRNCELVLKIIGSGIPYR